MDLKKTRQWTKLCWNWFRQPSLGAATSLCVMGTFLLAATAARAQLSITEMMSSALKTNGTVISTNNSDFWELTNFGSNAMDVTYYKFSDQAHSPFPLVPAGGDPLIIQGGESVVFVRSHPTSNEMQFRAWWGSCVGPKVQVRFFPKPGFSSAGDGIRVYDQNNALVDSEYFGPATRGTSFVYDTNTGAFGAHSILGQGFACQAATALDIGSPGKTTGPVPLRIVQQPKDQTVCLGLLAVFQVSAIGMPRPRYQWFFNDVAIPGSVTANLYVFNATPANAGRYRVVVMNGLETLQSSTVMLTVKTDPAPVSFFAPPVNVVVVTNRTARFDTTVCAFPAPTYQWFTNGVAMAGEVNPTVLIHNCTLNMSGMEVCVRAQNSLGTNTACAHLYVTTTPDLRFTEVQANPFTGCGSHHDWFEVTNFGTNAVDLLGYHFSDQFNVATALVVTQSMVVQPKESVIFARTPSDGSTSAFSEWWGVNQLPPGLKIFHYDGFSLSKDGDTLYLWYASAEDPNEAIDVISFGSSNLGISQQFDFDLFPFGCDSVPGEFGAIRALQCGDIGSPGCTTNPPPRVVSITWGASGAIVTWRAVEGKTYQVEYNSRPQKDGWTLLGKTDVTNSLVTMTDPGASGARRRFYRVTQLDL